MNVGKNDFLIAINAEYPTGECTRKQAIEFTKRRGSGCWAWIVDNKNKTAKRGVYKIPTATVDASATEVVASDETTLAKAA